MSYCVTLMGTQCVDGWRLARSRRDAKTHCAADWPVFSSVERFAAATAALKTQLLEGAKPPTTTMGSIGRNSKRAISRPKRAVPADWQALPARRRMASVDRRAPRAKREGHRSYAMTSPKQR